MERGGIILVEIPHIRLAGRRHRKAWAPHRLRGLLTPIAERRRGGTLSTAVAGRVQSVAEATDDEAAAVAGVAESDLSLCRVDVDVDLLAGKIVEQRSEEHTSELLSLMRLSYGVFCLKKQ